MIPRPNHEQKDRRPRCNWCIVRPKHSRWSSYYPPAVASQHCFFSVAAMTQQQTVIVVVPFAALVDDIIERGPAGLDCEEWISEKSGHELQQLIVVSATLCQGFGI